MQHGVEIDGQLLKPRTDAAAFLQPADTLLDHRPLPIGLLIKPRRRAVPGVFVFLVRNDRFDPSARQPVADTLDAVAFIAGQFSGFAATSAFARGDVGGNDRLELR